MSAPTRTASRTASRSASPIFQLSQMLTPRSHTQGKSQAAATPSVDFSQVTIIDWIQLRDVAGCGHPSLHPSHESKHKLAFDHNMAGGGAADHVQKDITTDGGLPQPCASAGGSQLRLEEPSSADGDRVRQPKAGGCAGEKGGGFVAGGDAAGSNQDPEQGGGGGGGGRGGGGGGGGKVEFFVETCGSAEQKARRFQFRAGSSHESELWVSTIRKASTTHKAREDRERARELSCGQRYRALCRFVNDSEPFKMFYSAIILFSFIMSMVEAQLRPARDTNLALAFEIFEEVFTGLFALEIVIGWSADWCIAYLKSPWNTFNLIIIILSFWSAGAAKEPHLWQKEPY